MQEEPVIDGDYEGPDFTCITFNPDWKRFHMAGMEADTIALLRKVYNSSSIDYFSPCSVCMRRNHAQRGAHLGDLVTTNPNYITCLLYTSPSPRD